MPVSSRKKPAQISPRVATQILPSLNLDVDASSVNGVVEVLGQKCQGQNLCDCLNMPPVTLCNSLAITRNIAQPEKGSQVIDLYWDFEKLF